MEQYDIAIVQLVKARRKLIDQNNELQYKINRNDIAIESFDKAIEKQKELDNHNWVINFSKELNSGVDNRYNNGQN